MNAWCRAVLAVCSAALLLGAGCGQRQEVSVQRAKQDTDSREDAHVVFKGDLVETIHGIYVNFPDSEKLTWIEVTDANPVDPKMVAIGHANVPPATAAKYALRAHRFATIGDYWVLCASFHPPIPDGGFNWVVDKRTMKYVGRFLDRNSR